MTELVLVGGGHAHVAVLKRFGMTPIAGVRVTLVSRGVDTPYSGMLPGLIAGHYTRDDAHIDLQRLSRFASARAVFEEAIGLDPAAAVLHCRNRPPIRYDLLSIDIGSTPNASVPGAAEFATPVKPIDRLLQRWDALQARGLSDDAPKRVAVVGGGAGGVELMLSVQFRIRTLLEAAGRRPDRIEYHLFTASSTILPAHNASARRMLERILADRGVRVHGGAAIAEVRDGGLVTSGGETVEVDEVLWTTEAKAASWLASSGLATDELGFVRVRETLQSTSHPNVFAAGDVASMERFTLEKSGVYAVRQGSVLADNLRRAALARPLRRYRPQRVFLSLISTGDRFAVASRGRFAVQGRMMWRWKDAIDRRFMRTYNELPEMKAGAGAAMQAAGRARPSEPSDPSHDGMRCGGCGAKIGSDVLSRALRRVRPLQRGDVLVGIDQPDDAAIVEVPRGSTMAHTVDFFRAIVDDPFVFGKIAANHALGDLYAMGAKPQTALAVVTIPHGPETSTEETLAELLAGALEVLNEAGAALVGGHTSEGLELGLGFAVNGLLDRDRVMRKGGLRPGDRLILTKPIGTGALFAADMRHAARGRAVAAAIASMTQSSRDASCCLRRHATACTDVTGFGLVGHLLEMLKASGATAEIDVASVPLLDGAEDAVEAGYLSSLHPDNLRLRRAVSDAGRWSASPRYELLFDPQTAGGLLAGVRPEAVEGCLAELRAGGYPHAAVIGTVRAEVGAGGGAETAWISLR